MRRGKPLELANLALTFEGFGQRPAVNHEEFERLLRPLGDQVKRFPRGANPVRFDEMDGGPRKLVARDLGKGQTGLGPCLANRAGPDGHALATPTASSVEHWR